MAQYLLVNGQSALEQRPRGGEIALSPKQKREVIEAGRGVRMFRARHFLANRQSALEQWARGSEVALGLKHGREGIEAGHGIRMFRAPIQCAQLRSEFV